jgi:hypothetical protein
MKLLSVLGSITAASACKRRKKLRSWLNTVALLRDGRSCGFSGLLSKTATPRDLTPHVLYFAGPNATIDTDQWKGYAGCFRVATLSSLLLGLKAERPDVTHRGVNMHEYA